MLVSLTNRLSANKNKFIIVEVSYYPNINLYSKIFKLEKRDRDWQKWQKFKKNFNNLLVFITRPDLMMQKRTIKRLL